MRPGHHTRLLGILLVSAVVAACGNTPRVAQVRPSPSGGDYGYGATPGADASASAQPGSTPGGGGGSGGSGGGGRGGHGGGGGGGNGGGGGGGGGSHSPVVTANGWTYYPANLYSGSDATTGITSSTISICMHAALTLGAAFNERQQDITVFWQRLNDNGGVIGRKVNFTMQDDAYTAQGAQQAFTNCQSSNPFFMMGGIGFDQDPVVRSLAEQHSMLYLYTMADDGSSPPGQGPPAAYKYSFTGAPTIEQAGTWLAQATLKNDPGTYGAVYVQDGNWIGGWKTYQSYMDNHGGSSVDGNAYTMNAGGDASAFDADIVKLQGANVQTVLLWMNALAADAFVAKASNTYNYHPAYVTVDGFDLVTGTVGEQVDDKASTHPMLATWITPAFDPDNQSVPWWPAEKDMLDAYSKYDSGHIPDDIDWQAWLAFKQVTDMLTICGNSCDRNDIAGIFQSGWTTPAPTTSAPLCVADFSRNHDFGGQVANLWKAHHVAYISADYPNASQHTVWVQTATCVNRFN